MSDHTMKPAADGQPTLGERVRSLRLPERPHQARGGISWFPWTVAGLFFVTTLYFAWQSFGAVPRQKDAAWKGVDLSAPKLVPGSDKQTDNVALESKGYIIPISLIQVSPIVGGKVMKLYITEGMKVDKGTLLAEIEDTEFDADFKRASGHLQAAKHRWFELFKYRQDEIRQARAEWEDARAQRDQLLAEYKRSLALKMSNAIAQKDFEQAESAYKSIEFRVERLKLALDLLQRGPRDERIAAAKAEMDQAEAEMIKAKWRLDNCKVYAPISGIILSKKAEEGNQVNPSAFSNGLSASLCEMADLTNMEVDLAIAERDIAKVFAGQECQVRAEAFPTRPYKGVVTRLMPTADRGKGAVPVRVKIEIPRAEEGQFLRPEMGAVVTFYSKKKD